MTKLKHLALSTALAAGVGLMAGLGAVIEDVDGA